MGWANHKAHVERKADEGQKCICEEGGETRALGGISPVFRPRH